jgi:hypothetical protein
LEHRVHQHFERLKSRKRETVYTGIVEQGECPGPTGKRLQDRERGADPTVFLRRGHSRLLDILLSQDIRNDQMTLDGAEKANELRPALFTKQVRFTDKDIGIANDEHLTSILASL